MHQLGAKISQSPDLKVNSLMTPFLNLKSNLPSSSKNMIELNDIFDSVSVGL
jgi:hypothetical protein